VFLFGLRPLLPAARPMNHYFRDASLTLYE
jgi:hypothetical protein